MATEYTNTSVTVTTSTTDVVIAKGGRSTLTIQNDGSADIYLSIGGADAALNVGMKLEAGKGVVFDGRHDPSVVRTKFTAIVAAATQVLIITEAVGGI